jgi:hypothetical protein
MSGNKKAAIRLLNDLMCDLLASKGSFRIYQTAYFRKKLKPKNKAILFRMHIFYILLSLAKLNEFYKKYKQCIPKDLRTRAKEIFQKEIESRGIISFRNKVVGHLHDKKTNQPLEIADINKRLNTIIGPDLNDFLLWIDNEDKNKESVVRLCVMILNRINADED